MGVAVAGVVVMGVAVTGLAVGIAVGLAVGLAESTGIAGLDVDGLKDHYALMRRIFPFYLSTNQF